MTPFSENGLLNFRRAIPAIILLFNSTILKAQTTIVTDSPFIKGTTVVIPGIKYKRSGYHNLFWGRHYRKEWSTPVRVDNFYIDTAAGGLTPTVESGSRQSQGLRLKNSEGKEFVLRSVDKDFGRALPEDFEGTFVTRIAKDQASIGYPFAAITITPMVQAAGIYHTNPRIVFVPSQAPLNQFNPKYGNQLYLFEERPDENQEGADYFGNSKNVIGSEKLFEHIYNDNDNRVDQKAFAKARLFDMFIGDWGRHPDNWRWAEFKEEKVDIYRPVPRDRDQAYTKFDGFWPWIGINIAGATHLESFSSRIHNVKKINKPGWPLDRPFANELTQQDWVAAAQELQRALTDQVIEYSIHQLPPELFAISGPAIIDKLKSRRDHLQDFAKSYYRFLSHHVELRGSNEREYFEIKRLNDDETRINIYKITKENQVKDKPYYSRTFTNRETKEVRIYSLGKADVFKVTGPPHGVKVRVIDPDGTDSISREERGRTKLSVGKKFKFDSVHTKKFDFFFLPFFSPPEYRVFENNPMGLFTKTGLRFSANARYIPQPWRLPQYMQSHLISANYGVSRNAFNIGYIGRFGHAVGPFDFLIKARYDPQGVQNYFGIGNESEKTNSKRNYYRTYTNRFYGGFGLSQTFGHYQIFDVTAFYQNVRLKRTRAHYITTDHSVDSILFSSRHFAGLEAAYEFRRTNNDLFPTKGIDFLLAGAYIQNLKTTDRSFTNVASSLSFYIPLGRSFCLALRGGGAALSGDGDFYHLNKLGGDMNLRGYDRERFIGKTTFYNNNELRWVTNTRNYFYNGKIGLFAFYDNGRVWQPLENSTKWHPGYGGGLVLIPFNRATLTGTYATSKEGPFILVKGSVFF